MWPFDIDLSGVRPDPQRRTDLDRHAFIRALDEADVNLNDWEAEFIGNNLDHREFSPAQRTVIDSLMTRFPHV